MASVSHVTKRYLLDFTFRLSIFLIIAAVYILHPQWLDFTVDQEGTSSGWVCGWQ